MQSKIRLLASIPAVLTLLAASTSYAAVDISKLNRSDYIRLSDSDKLELFSAIHPELQMAPTTRPLVSRYVKPTTLRRQLDRIIRAEATLWLDTVLEGDVALTGSLVADNVELLLIRDQLYGLTFVISAPAVGTFADDCRELPSGEWSEECPRGRVSVRKYVDFRFIEIKTDLVAEAEFD